ncbi:hypothetical protein DSCO28_03460 [Desulfosarcina ovata subsp. sediminis]|uniref:Uncharacterized protein n=1 Tax=Desulfosarcina ovata subsp. sediminis TaxID=885957 RepID=A0A5K7ZMR5_9BACT|nr:tetratricopeptide repeat protein [Desulfosarcina ovata]BBO79780.1 hypothetical protein DSCO28_03460 [Desulfosarcina ovata subsp. sediminis]
MRYEKSHDPSVTGPNGQSILKEALRHHKAGSTDSAKALYKHVLRLIPDNADALHLLGVIEHQEGNLTAARRLIGRAIKNQSNQPFFHNNLGNVLKDLGMAGDSLACYRRAIALKADYREAHHNQALAYCQLNDWENAAGCYERMLLRFPNDLQIEKQIADLYFEMGDHEKSAVLYQRVIKHDPMDYASYFKLGVIATHGNENDQAVEYYNQALRLNPELEEAWNNLGLLLKQEGPSEDVVRCFRKAIQISPRFHEALHNLGNAYVAMDRLEQAIACFKRVVEIKPDYANALIQLAAVFKREKDYDRSLVYYFKALKIKNKSVKLNASIGDVFIAQKRHATAKRFIASALELDPDCPEALFSLAVIESDAGNIERSIQIYHRILDLRPESKESYYNLACKLAELDRMHEAIQIAKKLLDIDPDHAEMHNNLGSYYRATGDIKSAIFHFKRAVEIDSSLAHPHFNLALTHLLCGDFLNGWKEYDWRTRVEQYKADYRYSDVPLWDGAPFRGKTLLIYDEQGLGDTLQFIRYLPLVKKLGGRVFFETRKTLIPLVGNFPGVDVLLERDGNGNQKRTYDLCIPLMSVPVRMGTTRSTIPNSVPYLSASHERKKKWQHVFKKKHIKIGIVWSGNKNHINDARRSCGIEHFKQIVHVPNLSFFSLQKDVSREEKAFLTRLGIDDIGSVFEDFADTAAVIDFLDLVISVDTSVVHLAGAMGKRVWALLAFDPDWRWLLETDKSPWYPSISLFRQKTPGDWTGVFDDIQVKLSEFARNNLP